MSLAMSPFRLGKLAFSYTCSVRAPLGVSMALGHACMIKPDFTQCVLSAWTVALEYQREKRTLRLSRKCSVIAHLEI